MDQRRDLLAQAVLQQFPSGQNMHFAARDAMITNLPLLLFFRMSDAPTPVAPSDEDLMLAYSRGDHAAFDQLYDRHKGKLFGFLLRGIGRRAQAEECFQEVWRRVIQARTRYEANARFGTWLYSIANRLLIDQYRRHDSQNRAMEQAEHEPQAKPEACPTPLDELSEFERRRRVQLAIERLPDEQRIALQLRLDHEYSLDHIAAITGTSRETVKSRLRYAKAKLMEELAP